MTQSVERIASAAAGQGARVAMIGTLPDPHRRRPRPRRADRVGALPRPRGGPRAAQARPARGHRRPRAARRGAARHRRRGGQRRLPDPPARSRRPTSRASSTPPSSRPARRWPLRRTRRPSWASCSGTRRASRSSTRPSTAHAGRRGALAALAGRLRPRLGAARRPRAAPGERRPPRGRAARSPRPRTRSRSSAPAASPASAELRLHHGTTWPWNRAVYDPAEGGHLRIELRALPAGPSVIDMAANAAFLVGATLGLAQEEWMLPAMPFELARRNFYRPRARAWTPSCCGPRSTRPRRGRCRPPRSSSA